MSLTENFRILYVFVAMEVGSRPILHTNVPTQAKVRAGLLRRKLPEGYRVVSTPILGGLHHEFRMEKEGCMTAD